MSLVSGVSGQVLGEQDEKFDHWAKLESKELNVVLHQVADSVEQDYHTFKATGKERDGL